VRTTHLDDRNSKDSRVITWRFFLGLGQKKNIFIFLDSYNPDLLLLSRYAAKLIISCSDQNILSKYESKISDSGILDVALIPRENIINEIDVNTINVFMGYSEKKNTKIFLDHLYSLILLFRRSTSCNRFLYNIKNPFIRTGANGYGLYSFAKILIGLLKIKKFNHHNVKLIKKCGGSFSNIIYSSIGPSGEAICIYGNNRICYPYYYHNFTSSKGNMVLKKILHHIIAFVGVNKVLSKEFLYLCEK